MSLIPTTRATADICFRYRCCYDSMCYFGYRCILYRFRSRCYYRYRGRYRLHFIYFLFVIPFTLTTSVFIIPLTLTASLSHIPFTLCRIPFHIPFTLTAFSSPIPFLGGTVPLSIGVSRTSSACRRATDGRTRPTARSVAAICSKTTPWARSTPARSRRRTASSSERYPA